MTREILQRGMAVAVLTALASVSPASAQSTWNERTILEFSEPVMVPGTTLQPGSYVFRLADMRSNRHTVQILSEDGNKLLTTTQAVPVKRLEPKGDNVLRFKATDAGSPPALASWFYPGSVYGHQFIYPEAQAKEIAGRTKSIVLSEGAPNSDMSQGTLHVFNESAMRAEWKEDAGTAGEWQAWLKSRQSSGTDNTSGGVNDPRSSAPMVNAASKAQKVAVDELEDNAQKYVGQKVRVDAVIQDVFGPRLFTIDEPNWGDLEGEILVYVPTGLGALVQADDRITVEGTVKTFVQTDVEREWGWLGLGGDLEVQYQRKPMLVAERVIGGTNNTALLITAAKGSEDDGNGRNGNGNGNAKAASGSSTGALTTPSALSDRNQARVGRQVDLSGVTVESVAKDGGFFINADDGRVFVLPASTIEVSVDKGDTLALDGVLMEMPRGMTERLSIPRGSNDDVYVYATTVDK